VVHRASTLAQRTQTAGVVLPETEVKIVDPATGATLGPGQPGELCARGACGMKGYYSNPEATRAATDADGWLNSGDQATIGEDGFVRITGRIKEIIIRGGERRIARSKIPRHIRFVDAFPQTASGKIQKFKLRETHEGELGVRGSS
jgi:acyl-CoA synthetase (AMP-forming)/AMP-acid ligase II